MKIETRTYNFAKEFTRFPGGRLRKDGPFSGEEFREDVLLPLLEQFQLVKMDLSDTRGFGSSFIDESFGEVAKRLGLERVMRQLEFTVNDDPMLESLVLAKMKKAAHSD